MKKLFSLKGNRPEAEGSTATTATTTSADTPQVRDACFSCPGKADRPMCTALINGYMCPLVPRNSLWPLF